MNYNAEMPIYLQVINDLKKKMIQGKILPGEKLPSNRELAVLYKINQNTAARIYREMETHGYCYTKRGIGTFVMEEETMFEIFLEHSIELPSVGRQLVDVLPVKNDISGIRSLETTQNSKQRGLTAAAWTEQG